MVPFHSKISCNNCYILLSWEEFPPPLPSTRMRIFFSNFQILFFSLTAPTVSFTLYFFMYKYIYITSSYQSFVQSEFVPKPWYNTNQHSAIRLHFWNIGGGDSFVDINSRSLLTRSDGTCCDPIYGSNQSFWNLLIFDGVTSRMIPISHKIFLQNIAILFTTN